MKKLILAAVLAAVSCAFAGYNDIKPGANVKYEALTSVQWENTNDVALAEATAPDVLADFAADRSSAEKLLAEVRGAYVTDPIVACQVGAVTQWVMLPEPCPLAFWKPSPAAGRKVWVKALIAAAEKTDDTYVKLFLLEQLRWCGCNCPNLIARIRLIGIDANDRAVKDFSEMVVRELKGAAVGL